MKPGHGAIEALLGLSGRAIRARIQRLRAPQATAPQPGEGEQLSDEDKAALLRQYEALAEKE